MQKKTEQKTNQGENDQKANWSPLLWCYFISLAFLFIGFAWLNDIKTKGYYTYHKHQLNIPGDDGIITVYFVIVGGFVFLIYSIYSTLKRIRNNKQTNAKPG